MQEYVVVVARERRDTFYVGPFLSVDDARKWILKNETGFFRGGKFSVAKLVYEKEDKHKPTEISF